MHRLKYFLFVFLLASCDKKNEKEWTVDTVPNPKESPGWDYVSNPDSVLTEATVARINDYLKALEQTTTDQGAVVILNSIGTTVPKQFATGLFRKWGIGQRDKNNGFLMLLVIGQRRVEFEIGYGLEGTLTDVFSKRIQEQYMLPYAREGDYDAAVINGVEQICLLLKGGDAPAASFDGGERQLPDQLPYLPEEGVTSYGEPMPGPAFQENTQREKAWLYLTDVFPYVVLTFFLFVAYFMRNQLIKKNRNNDFTQTYRTRSFFIKQLLLDLFYVVLFILLLGRFSILKAFLFIYGYVVWKTCVAIFFIKRWLRKEVQGKEREEVYSLTRQVYIRWPQALRYVLPLPLSFYFRTLLAAMERLRNKPVFADDGNPMIKLDELSDDEHLEKSQIKEEELQAVDYDVWYKAQTGERKIFRYELFSKFEDCPKCKAITYSLTANNILYAATYSSTGKGVRIYNCKYCNYEMKAEYTIAKLAQSSSSNSGSGSSSSGGSSWGGGSSGGGGAGSSW